MHVADFDVPATMLEDPTRKYYLVVLDDGEFERIAAVECHRYTIDALCYPDGDMLYLVELDEVDGDVIEEFHFSDEECDFFGLYSTKENALKVADLLKANNEDEAYNVPSVFKDVELEKVSIPLHSDYCIYEDRESGLNFPGRIVSAFITFDVYTLESYAMNVNYSVLTQPLGKNAETVHVKHEHILSSAIKD